MRSSGKSVALVEFKNGGIDNNNYGSRLELVLDALNNGAIGDGCHGSADHRAALVQVVERAQQVIAKIDNPPPKRCNRHDDCDAADAHFREIDRALSISACAWGPSV